MMLTDWLITLLKNDFTPTHSEVVDRIPELATFLEKKALKELPAWCPPEMKEFLKYTAENLRQWAAVCKKVLKTTSR
jgi:hypothetical protein